MDFLAVLKFGGWVHHVILEEHWVFKLNRSIKVQRSCKALTVLKRHNAATLVIITTYSVSIIMPLD